LGHISEKYTKKITQQFVQHMVIKSDEMVTKKKNREPKGVQPRTQTASLTLIKVS